MSKNINSETRQEYNLSGLAVKFLVGGQILFMQPFGTSRQDHAGERLYTPMRKYLYNSYLLNGGGNFSFPERLNCAGKILFGDIRLASDTESVVVDCLG